jgi:hypothetical protein
LAALARRHGLFAVVLLVGAVVRLIAMLGFRGPLWTPDSTGYIADAVHLTPGTVRPSGYSIMLWLLGPLHSLTAVQAVQHLMGLAVAVIGYALLRRRGLPGWGATLAMVPVLLSAYAIQLEQFIMSDTLFALLVMIAIALMMWWPVPPLWACAVTGVLLAGAGLTRSEGLPLLLVFLIFLIIRFARWRTVASVALMAVAFALPMAGYAAWYDSAHGSFALGSSTGAFLYGGVATFADCGQMNPPAAERQLCLNVPNSQRKWPDYYIWAGPLSRLPGGPFGTRANTLGKNFALDAIKAQPLDYLHTVGSYLWMDFLPPPSGNSPSPVTRNRALHLREFQFPVTGRHASALTTRIFTEYDRSGPALRVVSPYAGWIRSYQRYLILPGPLLGVIVLAGLAGVVAAWRRLGGAALLPWLAGLGMLVTPAALAESYPRYLVADVAPLCVAAAFGVAQLAEAARGWRARRGPAAG